MRALGRLVGGYQCPRERLNFGSWPGSWPPWVCSCLVEEHAPALEGTLVRLRAHEPADIAVLNDLINDPDVGENLGMVMPQAVAGYQAFIDMIEKDPSKSSFVIERIEGRVPIGGCSFFTVETPVGALSVSVPNHGEEPAGEGDAVALDWTPASLRVEAVTATTGAAA